MGPNGDCEKGHWHWHWHLHLRNTTGHTTRSILDDEMWMAKLTKKSLWVLWGLLGEPFIFIITTHLTPSSPSAPRLDHAQSQYSTFFPHFKIKFHLTHMPPPPLYPIIYVCVRTKSHWNYKHMLLGLGIDSIELK